MDDNVSEIVWAVDGGGTRCRLACERGGRRFSVTAGAANATTDFDGTIAALSAGLAALAAQADVSEAALRASPGHVAVAGMLDTATAARLRDALRLADAEVTDDRCAAVRGALGGADGAVAALGTGSFFAVAREGAVRFAGGWGARLGDEASGHWIGREALTATLAVQDGLRASTPLSDGLCAMFGGAPIRIVAFAACARPDEVAALAPSVIAAAEAGDDLAQEVLRRAAGHVSDTLVAMGWQPGARLSVIGGVGPAVARYLPPEVRAGLVEPEGSALDGALALARERRGFCPDAPVTPAAPRCAPQSALTLYHGGAVFDGETLHEGCALLHDGRAVIAFGPKAEAGPQAKRVDLEGDVLCPGFVDLQVNGGGGVMLNDAPSLATLRRMAAAHGRLGATTILPTLISDTPDTVAAAIEAVAQAVAAGVPGIGGLHLEGPHLAPARAGAHDPGVLRPMSDADCGALCAAAARLPVLIVTLAPEMATPTQVATLAEAGAVVALGHTQADFDTCCAYADAGAQVVTHLFNAMGGLGHRTPGVVGAALDHGGLSAGLIADGVHVHPVAMRAACAAKSGPGQVFLVSDAMAVAGTDQDGFSLGGRTVARRGGRLVLDDGTLAGADLDLAHAVSMMTGKVGLPLATALRMATSVPARVAGLGEGVGRLAPGGTGPMLRLSRSEGRVALRAVIWADMPG